MVKKLICLLLVLTTTFAFFACGEDTSDDSGKDSDVTTTPLDDFLKLVNDSQPNEIRTVSTLTDKKTPDDVYVGVYVSNINADGSYLFTYNYELRRAVSPENYGSTSNKEVIEGSLLVSSDGRYSADGGESWQVGAPDINVINVRLNLVKEYFADARLAANGKMLTANLTAEKAGKVLGINIDATSDVVLKIKTNGVRLSEISVEYSNDSFKTLIVTSYTCVGDTQEAAE